MRQGGATASVGAPYDPSSAHARRRRHPNRRPGMARPSPARSKRTQGRPGPAAGVWRYRGERGRARAPGRSCGRPLTRRVERLSSSGTEAERWRRFGGRSRTHRGRGRRLARSRRPHRFPALVGAVGHRGSAAAHSSHPGGPSAHTESRHAGHESQARRTDPSHPGCDQSDDDRRGRRVQRISTASVTTFVIRPTQPRLISPPDRR